MPTNSAQIQSAPMPGNGIWIASEAQRVCLSTPGNGPSSSCGSDSAIPTLDILKPKYGNTNMNANIPVEWITYGLMRHGNGDIVTWINTRQVHHGHDVEWKSILDTNCFQVFLTRFGTLPHDDCSLSKASLWS
ncbi:hypothetical protein ACA910_020585 [Epithemia clementina (nom. ined.)]